VQLINVHGPVQAIGTEKLTLHNNLSALMARMQTMVQNYCGLKLLFDKKRMVVVISFVVSFFAV
jgi:hypothetical protein